jgi:hypothetical protein
MANKKSNSIVLGTLEGAEAFIDFVTSNEAVKAVPVVSTAVRLLEGIDDFRSRLLQNKLKKFLEEPSLLRSLQAQQLSADILSNPEKMEAIGDTLFLVIDKVTDSEKPAILAKIYAHLLNGSITLDDFFLLAHCIDICALVDLQSFIALRGDVNSAKSASKVRLVTAGLFKTEVSNSKMFTPLPTMSGNDVRVLYSVTDLGEHLLSAIDAARSH